MHGNCPLVQGRISTRFRAGLIRVGNLPTDPCSIECHNVVPGLCACGHQANRGELHSRRSSIVHSRQDAIRSVAQMNRRTYIRDDVGRQRRSGEVIARECPIATEIG